MTISIETARSLFRGKSNPERLRTYPQGYDSSGKSLYYDRDIPNPDLSYWLPGFLAKELRFGEASSLNYEHLDRSLSTYVRASTKKGVPVYIFDGHNHAFFAWNEAISEKRIGKSAVLFHFDAHEDGRQPDEPPSQDLSLEGAAEYARSVGIASFIRPAQKMGLISMVYWIDSKKRKPSETNFCRIGIDSALALLKGMDSQKVIVDIDLDYFDYVLRRKNENKTLKQMRLAMSRAGVVTLATSPGFINQGKAIELARVLVR